MNLYMHTVVFKMKLPVFRQIEFAQSKKGHEFFFFFLEVQEVSHEKTK